MFVLLAVGIRAHPLVGGCVDPCHVVVPLVPLPPQPTPPITPHPSRHTHHATPITPHPSRHTHHATPITQPSMITNKLFARRHRRLTHQPSPLAANCLCYRVPAASLRDSSGP
ncbi:hypothetical protein T484DRAFT_3519644 [Baffinella frigidus]|nr:hypothetical protein T484DRAFT_3519644 [Cryptophyta sp. CCMP2293]